MPTTRLIPAHAGKTGVPSFVPKEEWAHPRSRGENRVSIVPPPNIVGSSPLTRGKQGNLTDSLVDSGLIPAHAGKTCKELAAATGHRAHPRSRGENRAEIAAIQTRAGSSPLTRGKHAACASGDDLARLIPAHAGKTFSRNARLANDWAHPRSRGENL